MLTRIFLQSLADLLKLMPISYTDLGDPLAQQAHMLAANGRS